MVLSAILEKNGTQLNDEALSTFMCEAEAIENSRPLTVNKISSPDSLEALTPNHLLTIFSFLPLKYSRQQTSTYVIDGDESSTFLTSSGHVGGKNSSNLSENVRSASDQDEI